MSRRTLVAVVATLAVSPATAGAATTVESVSGVVIVEGDAGANAITLAPQDEYVVISEAGGVVTDTDERDDCEQDGVRVRCSTLGALATIVVRGGEGDDTLTADTVAVMVSLNGQSGADVLNSSPDGPLTELAGGPGNDTLNARAGSLDARDGGGDGDDVFNGNPQVDDAFRQEPGADTYSGGTRAFTSPACAIDPEYCSEDDRIGYTTGPVTVTLDGAPGDGAGEGDNVSADVESVSGTALGDVLSAAGSVNRHALTGGAGDDALTGGAGDDALLGGDGADQLAGGGGDDLLASGADEAGAPAPDRMDGGDGNDGFETGRGADEVLGGAGLDSVSLSRLDATGIPVGFDVTLDGQPNDGARGTGEGDNVHPDVDIVSTGAGADRIVGAPGAQQLSGWFGDDEIDGGGGVDVLSGDNGADAMTSRDLGFDVVDCGDGADPAVQADEGDRLENCEAAVRTPVAPPADTTPPALALSGRRTIAAASFGRARGVSVIATPGEPSALFAEGLAKGMIASVGDLVLGERRFPLAPGSRRIKVTFKRSHVRAIQRRLRRRSYQVALRVTAIDAAGNDTTTRRTITIAKAKRKKRRR